jgi:hypothetical protein
LIFREKKSFSLIWQNITVGRRQKEKSSCHGDCGKNVNTNYRNASAPNLMWYGCWENKKMIEKLSAVRLKAL